MTYGGGRLFGLGQVDKGLRHFLGAHPAAQSISFHLGLLRDAAGLGARFDHATGQQARLVRDIFRGADGRFPLL